MCARAREQTKPASERNEQRKRKNEKKSTARSREARKEFLSEEKIGGDEIDSNIDEDYLRAIIQRERMSSV